MNIYVVFQQMLMLCSMMAIGFLIYKLKWLEQTHTKALSALVVNLFNPFLTIDSVLGQSLATTGSVFWQNLVLVFFFYVILYLAGFCVLLLLHPQAKDRPVYRLLTLLPNCGFMGIPVVISLLGKQYVIYVAIYMLFFNLLLYTIGISLAKKSGEKNTYSTETSQTWFERFKPLLCNAGIISSTIALFLFFGQIRVPQPVATLCKYMGTPCVPLSMILIGCSVAASQIGTMLKNLKMYFFMILRMILLPVAGAFLTRLIPFDATILKLFVIMLAMPCGSMVVLVTEEYDGNTTLASNGVILTTLSAILTLPIVSLFL